MADMYGRRRLYLIGLCIYLVCAVLTGAIKVRLSSAAPIMFRPINMSLIEITQKLVLTFSTA